MLGKTYRHPDTVDCLYHVRTSAMYRGNQQGQTKEKEMYAELLAKRNENNLSVKLLFLVTFWVQEGDSECFRLIF